MTYHLYHLVFIGGVMFMTGVFMGLWAANDTINYYKGMYYVKKECCCQEGNHTEKRAV